MTYEELERLVANPLPNQASPLAEVMQGLVDEQIVDAWHGMPESERTPQKCLQFLEDAYVNADYIYIQIQGLVPEATPEQTVVFQLTAMGDSCKITFDHFHRVYRLEIDQEGDGLIQADVQLSKLMQIATDEFIKPRETAEGFIPGAFIV